MNSLRRFGLGLAIIIFTSGLSLTPILIGTYAVFDTPAALKQALRQSDIYSTPLQDLAPIDDQSLPISDPGIKKALNDAFPADFLQNSAEGTLDSVYNWMHGTAPSPNISVDLSQIKTNFASNVASYIQQKFSALPVCATFTTPPSTLDDLVTLTCRPYGASAATIADKARQEILASSFGNKPVDAGTLTTAETKPLNEQLAFLPASYHYFMLALYIIPIITLLCLIAVIFWSAPKRAGIKRAGWLLITIGATTAVGALLMIWLLQVVVNFLADPAAASLQSKLMSIIQPLANQMGGWMLWFSAGYAVTGIVLLVILASTRPKEPTLTFSSSHYPDSRVTK